MKSLLERLISRFKEFWNQSKNPFKSKDYTYVFGANTCSPFFDIKPAHRVFCSLPDYIYEKVLSGENIDPSLFARDCLSRRLSDIYQLNFREMAIRRTEKGGELQPPYLYYKNKKAPFDISLSHDGQFVAYAFLLCGQDSGGVPAFFNANYREKFGNW